MLRRWDAAPAGQAADCAGRDLLVRRGQGAYVHTKPPTPTPTLTLTLALALTLSLTLALALTLSLTLTLTKALRREGQRLEARYGRDRGNGWAYNHACGKLRRYQVRIGVAI